MLRRPALVTAAATAVLVITGALAVAPAASGQRGTPASAARSPSRSAPAAGATLASAAAPSGAFPASAALTLVKEALAAWNISRGQGATVAVLSDGVDPIDGLAGKLTQGPDYAPLRGASQEEGTLLASIIAGGGPTSAQPFGGIGVAPGAKILSVRVNDTDNTGSAADNYFAAGTWQDILAKGIRYAVDHGAGVIMLDDGGSAGDDPGLDSAVAYAVSKNVILIGDEGYADKPSEPDYPDSLPGVINYTAQPLTPLPNDDTPSTMPDNNSVLVSAPGDEVEVNGPDNDAYPVWDFYTAAGFVAGTAAIIKSVYPHITDAEMEAALAESATNRPSGGYSTKVGFGLINPQGALEDAAKLVKDTATAPTGATALSADARFGSRPVAVIEAVHHARSVLETDGGAILAGLVLLIVALILLIRRKPRPAAAGAPGLALSASPFGYAAPPGGVPAGPGQFVYVQQVPPGTVAPPAGQVGWVQQVPPGGVPAGSGQFVYVQQVPPGGVPAGSGQFGYAQQVPPGAVSPPAGQAGYVAPAAPAGGYYVPPAEPAAPAPAPAPAAPVYYVAPAEPAAPAAEAERAEPAAPAGPVYYVAPAEPAAPAAPAPRYYVAPAPVPPAADGPASPASGPPAAERPQGE